MKRILLLILVISSVLTGCDLGANEMSFLEVNIDEVSSDVKEFINHVTLLKEETGNGIYMFNDTEKRRYLYLSQDFLDKGRGFGDIDIRAEENSINIYSSDSFDDEKESNKYKLYEINLDKSYEYMKVFKNDEETYFQTIGI